MTKTIKAMAVVLGFGVCAMGWADEPAMNMPVRVDSKDFQQMKQLVGTWRGSKEGDAPGEPEKVEVDYKLTAGGSTLQETLMPGSPHEMVTMYHDEGGKLAMTHYCMMGNTPHMVAAQSSPKQIQFKFVPGAGIDATKDAHMDGLTLEFADNDHLVQRWSCHMPGKPDHAAVFNLTRVKA
jgi:hypothetical protein